MKIKRKHVSVQFDPELIRRVKVVAANNGETYSDTLNRMVSNGIEAEESRADENVKIAQLGRKPTIAELDAILGR